MKSFKLRGFVILKSSENHYLAVFDRAVSRSENVKVMAWAALLTHKIGQLRYLQMLCIKESSTLRVSSKGGKPSPRIVYRFGKQDEEIDS